MPSWEHFSHDADMAPRLGANTSIRSFSARGVAEEAPGAYKDLRAVVDAAEMAGLAMKSRGCSQ